MRSASRLTRRRVLTIIGAAGVLATPALLSAGAARGAHSEVPVRRWRGQVLGTEASITLVHPEPDEANRLVLACLDEIERLERAFSLYRLDSELVRLNRLGALAGPSHDLLRLLAESQRFGVLSEGAFDVSVQPLWRLYADHFARRGGDGPGPDPDAVRAAAARVDYRAIEVGASRVALDRPGMALTLNGIAQGYICDRVAELLRAEGIGRVLLDLGEIRASGERPGGGPWQIAVRDPREPELTRRILPLAEGALASSGGYGFAFERSGRHHHLFDPKSGASAHGVAGVTVMAPDATTADALSTALAVTTPEQAASLLRAAGPARAWLTLPDGTVRSLHA